MDLYLCGEELSKRYTPVEVVDGYLSLIWTERYYGWGDFELTMQNTPGVKESMPIGSRFRIPDSDKIMVLETVERKWSDGRDVLVFSGRSLEHIFDHRTTWMTAESLSGARKGVNLYEGTPSEIMTDVVRNACVNNTDTNLSADNFGVWMSSSVIETNANGIPHHAESIKFEAPFGNLYSFIKMLSEAYKTGFRIKTWYNQGTGNSEAQFRAYKGADKTSGQSFYKPVIFGEDMDTITEVSSLESSASHKNVLYYVGKNAVAFRYALGTSANTSALDRRVVIVVDERNELPAGADFNKAADHAAYEVFSQNSPVLGFDGSIPSSSPYIYGFNEDYYLGDLVEIRDANGNRNNMMVTEHIYTIDGEGVKSFPTLTLDSIVTASSWASRSSVEYWNLATGEWVNA